MGSKLTGGSEAIYPIAPIAKKMDAPSDARGGRAVRLRAQSCERGYERNYECTKTCLERVVRDASVLAAIQDAAMRAHAIVTHTLHFLKLYVIHCYDAGVAVGHVQLPAIDAPFVL